MTMDAASMYHYISICTVESNWIGHMAVWKCFDFSPELSKHPSSHRFAPRLISIDRSMLPQRNESLPSILRGWCETAFVEMTHSCSSWERETRDSTSVVSTTVPAFAKTHGSIMMIPTNIDVYRSIHADQALPNYFIQYDSQAATLIFCRCNNFEAIVFFY